MVEFSDRKRVNKFSVYNAVPLLVPFAKAENKDDDAPVKLSSEPAAVIGLIPLKIPLIVI